MINVRPGSDGSEGLRRLAVRTRKPMVCPRFSSLLPLIAGLLYTAGAEAGRSMGFEVAGTRYYITGVSLWALGLLYTPLVLGLIGLAYALILRLLPKWIKWSLVVLVLSGGAVLPFIDVYLIGQEAKTLCQDAGLKIYKTVEVEGFYGGSSIKYWSEYGFKYVESSGSGKYSHWTLVDGKKHHQYLEQHASRYGTNSSVNEILSLHFSRSRFWVEDIQTKEILGELMTFSIYPGWVDSLVIPALGGSFTPWICGKWVPEELQDRFGDKYGRQDLIKSTLIPKSKEGEAN